MGETPKFEGYATHGEPQHGGQATVYRATRLQDGLECAIKVPTRQDDHEQRRLDREFRALHGLQQSPHAVNAVELGLSDSRFGARTFLVMEYLQGISLRDYLRDLNSASILDPSAETSSGSSIMPPANELIAIATGMARGIHAVHQAGWLHRDLTPQNVLLEDGDPARPILIDFGIATTVGRTQPLPVTGTLQIFGTPGYIAPERISSVSGLPSQSQFAGDIYGLACCLYFLVTGLEPPPLHFPFMGPARAPQWPGLDRAPDAIRELIQQCSDLDPSRRWTVETCIARLELARTSAPSGPPDNPPRRRRYRAVLPKEINADEATSKPKDSIAKASEIVKSAKREPVRNKDSKPRPSREGRNAQPMAKATHPETNVLERLGVSATSLGDGMFRLDTGSYLILTRPDDPIELSLLPPLASTELAMTALSMDFESSTLFATFPLYTEHLYEQEDKVLARTYPPDSVFSILNPIPEEPPESPTPIGIVHLARQKGGPAYSCSVSIEPQLTAGQIDLGPVAVTRLYFQKLQPKPIDLAEIFLVSRQKLSLELVRKIS